MRRHRKTSSDSSREPNSESDETPDKDLNSRYANRFGCSRNIVPRRTRRALRRKKIQRIKNEIQRGIYETDEKLAIAIDRLVEDVLRRRNR